MNQDELTKTLDVHSSVIIYKHLKESDAGTFLFYHTILPVYRLLIDYLLFVG